MDSLELTLDTGRVRGFWRIGLDARDPSSPSAAFLGIPFAEPPVGDLRFSAPVPRLPWSGVLQTTTFGPTAQKRPFGEVTAILEPSLPGDDILTVNVFTPRPGDEGARLPVLFWIHGGGFKAGSPASPWYDGHAFNTDGVVVVTVGYRLGFDGFASIPGPQNRGLLDQIEALHWVRRNITTFGGDPDRVTIAGQSAGGGSVLALVASPLAQGLFSAAISESGALDLRDPQAASAMTAEVAATLGVEATVEGFRTATPDAILDASEDLERARAARGAGKDPVSAITEDTHSLPFFPVADPVSLPADWLSAVQGSRIRLLLMGTTAHEFTAVGEMFSPMLAGVDVPAMLASSRLGDLADDLVTAYPGFTGGRLVGQLLSLVAFRQWVPVIGRGRVAPMWAYDFRWVNATSGLATHCADIPFFWHVLADAKVAESSGPDAPPALADLMHATWIEFVGTHAVGWDVWRPDSPRTMVFDQDSRVADDYVLESYLADRLGTH